MEYPEQNMLVCEIGIVYKTKIKPSQRPNVNSSADTYKIFMHYWNKDTIELKEDFMVMFLNRNNKVIGIHNISSGGICGTVADQRLIFGLALKTGAVNIVMAHNHPSGNIYPSSPDFKLTEELCKVGQFHNIKVIDHLIISKESYYSFKDEEMIA